jgi:hypothetical protein
MSSGEGPEQRERGGLDELLTPTLAEQRAHTPSIDRPWRLGSQVYVAFFGGVLAVTAIAILNARRLGMAGKSLWLMGAVGAAGLAGALTVVALIGDSGSGSSSRIPARIVALAACGVLFLLQRRADRVYHYHARADDPYDSLLGPGLIACFTVGILEAILIVVVRGA